ncbi:MAG TPA: pyridoxal phosphate-dependent aminotransferase [Firmicutes bacterium]|nr:pyridoxal phosphate-dependent aminotransferase [Bacillota bacterium]
MQPSKGLARRARELSPSPTLALDAKAKQMKRAGIDVISFGVGEPDFDTPAHIKAAAIEAIQEGFTKYTPSNGIPQLQEAIAAKLQKDNGLHYEPNQIVVSVGAKHAIFNALQVLCEPGDEVLILAPYWVSYPEMVKLTGAQPVIVETKEENGFKVTVDDLERASSSNTKLLLLNTPCNPSGCVYSREELEQISRFVVEKDIWVISDEIYEKLVYGSASHISIASFNSDVYDRTITVNGVSKAYAMTGWRIGYSASPKNVAKAIGDFQSQCTSNATSISQKAALAALTGTQEPITAMVAEFKNRRDYMVARLNRIDGVKCQVPDGAFYVFPSFKSLLNRRFKGQVLGSTAALADILLNEAKVAIVPGEAFGMPGYMRFSYATSMEKIREGLDRMERILDSLEV